MNREVEGTLTLRLWADATRGEDAIVTHVRTRRLGRCPPPAPDRETPRTGR
jgi:hypothetical protein